MNCLLAGAFCPNGSIEFVFKLQKRFYILKNDYQGKSFFIQEMKRKTKMRAEQNMEDTD